MALTLVALILTVSPAEQRERYEVALQTFSREAARYHATIRDYEHRISEEPDDAKAQVLQERLRGYERGTGALLEGIWLEVEKMRAKIKPLPVEAA